MKKGKKKRKYRESSAKASERLHRLRMMYKEGYADGYWNAIGFTKNEIAIKKATGHFPGPHHPKGIR